MASTVYIYDSFRQYVADGTIDLTAATVTLALVTSSYTYSAAHTVWADASANEVANGAGYTTNGAALGSPTVTYSGSTATFDASDVTWSSLTKTFRGGVLYLNDTVNAIVKPVILYILFDSTPADITISGADFTVAWNASGILTFS